MLRADVVEAAREGKFRIFAISSVDEGLELLTGIPAGATDVAGDYPEGTLNHRIVTRLARLEAKAIARRPPVTERQRRTGNDQ
jgi:hypothetical protein